MLEKLLKQLNFSKKETSVYLALVELESVKAKELSRKTGLNRTTIYDICDALLKRGLISKYKKGASTFFNALDPKHLVTYLDREKEEQVKKIEKQKEKATELLPQLISLQNIYSVNKPRVQFFEGKKGMREAYEDTLNSKEIILCYANPETMHEGFPNFMDYYKRRVQKKIFVKVIVPQNKITIERRKLNQGEMRDIRFLPEKEMPFLQRLIFIITRC